MSQALTIKFNTDLAGAQQAIAKFATDTAGNLARVAQGVSNAKKTLDLVKESAGALKLGLGIAAVAFVAVKALAGIVAAAAAARASLDELVKIGTGAASAGVGTSFFQAFTGQAKGLKVETSELVAMLQKAREAATETIGENGAAATSFGRDRIRQNIRAGNLGQGALTSFDAANTQEERARVILGLLDEMIAKSDHLAAFDLAKTFFGSNFETQLRNGADVIGKMRASLDGLAASGGARIIPESEINNAIILNNRLQDIENRIATGLKPINEVLVSIQQDMLSGLIDIKEKWLDIIGVVGKLIPLVKSAVAEIKDFNDFLNDMARRTNRALGLNPPNPFGDLVDIRGQDQGPPALTVHGDRSKPLPSLTPKTAKPAAASAPTDQVESYIKSLQRLAAAEKAEADTLGLGNKAKQEAVDLARAMEAARERGTPLTAAEAANVKALADAYVDAKDKIAAFDKAQETAKASAEFFGNTLEGAIEKLATGGGSLRSVLRDVVKLLEQAAIKALILGEGPLASLFGTAGSGKGGIAGLGGIFGQLLNFLPKFADGGDLPAGRFGIVGMDRHT
ncbi:MAG: hypothetical protein ACT4O2_12670 [Beijerinckiaceae bacterium]